MTPTIIFMQDQIHKFNDIQVLSVLLGSSQLDKLAEVRALNPDSKEQLIFVTPEWITKPSNLMKLHSLAHADKLSLIEIDEAHLYTEWNDFRNAFSELPRLKSDFLDVPIMTLTATATEGVENDIKLPLRNPVISKSSVNRPNITLKVEELSSDSSSPAAVQFGKKVAEIINSMPSIVYTDFIADIGPIVSALQEVGVDAVGYHGEIDALSQHESYVKWKSGQVKTIVATKAFGIGVDKPDIRHVVQNGILESLQS